MADQAETIILNLAREMKSWKSIEMHIREDITNYVPIGPAGSVPANHILTRYIETSRGQRLMETTRHAPNGKIWGDAAYCDGSRCAFTMPGTGRPGQQPEIRINNSFHTEGSFGATSRPHHLQFLYAGKVPLYDALAKAEVVGTAHVLGRETDGFLFRDLLWGAYKMHLVFSLDRETSMPLKVEAFRTEEDRGRNLPAWLWTAKKVERVQGHLVAMASEFASYTKERPGQPRTLVSVRKEVVEEVKFDREYPATTFWPEIAGDAKVLDSIQGKVTLPPGSRPAPHAVAVGEGLRVTPERDWTPIVSSLALGLGLAVLVAGLAAWWRGRRA